MGHSLLGRLQMTKEWKDVIVLIAGSEKREKVSVYTMVH